VQVVTSDFDTNGDFTQSVRVVSVPDLAEAALARQIYAKMMADGDEAYLLHLQQDIGLYSDEELDEQDGEEFNNEHGHEPLWNEEL
jgi:hypothetical protein